MILFRINQFGEDMYVVARSFREALRICGVIVKDIREEANTRSLKRNLLIIAEKE